MNDAIKPRNYVDAGLPKGETWAEQRARVFERLSVLDDVKSVKVTLA